MNSSRVVVIAYGNPLRGDDGLAWRVAGQLKKTFASSEVEIFEQQLLVPELAEPMIRAKAVIFVDAAAPQDWDDAGEIHVVELGKEETLRARESAFHHQVSPASLLALAARLYRARPRAYIATLNGQDFSPGERLSAPVERAMPEFVARIENLIRDLSGSG
jgi:hydrogenase maturation protease